MSTGTQLPREFDTRSFLKLAVPMIISRAGLTTMGIADGIMVSRYQSHEFAWLSLAEGTLGRLLDIFCAFLIAGLVLVPRHFGGGDVEELIDLVAHHAGLLGARIFGLVSRTVRNSTAVTHGATTRTSEWRRTCDADFCPGSSAGTFRNLRRCISRSY